jgi:hypothetical protein
VSASGKSRNRLSEYNRGYFAGTGSGPYALQGMEDRRRHDQLTRGQAAQDDDAGQAEERQETGEQE